MTDSDLPVRPNPSDRWWEKEPAYLNSPGLPEWYRTRRTPEVHHACPECPSPLHQIAQPPRALCPWCAGTGLVTVEMLGKWQAHQYELMGAAP